VDGGDSWARLVNGLDNRRPLSYLAISASDKNVLYASTPGDGVYRTDDGGSSWARANNGLEDPDIGLIAVSPYSANDVFAAGNNGGLYKTENGGGAWSRVLKDDVRVTSLVFSDGKGRIIAGAGSGEIYFSADSGNSWNHRYPSGHGGSHGPVTAICLSPGFSKDRTFLIGTEGRGVFITKDGGASFKEIAAPAINNVRDIRFSAAGDRIFISTWSGGIFCSEDGGKRWRSCSKNLQRHIQADDPANLSLEQDEGASPRPHFSDIRISDGFASDRTLFAGCFMGLYKSADGGVNWRELNTFNSVISALTISPDYGKDSTVAAVSYTGEVYLTRDGGSSWEFMSGELKRIFRRRYDFKSGSSEMHALTELPRWFDAVFSPGYGTDGVICFTTLWTKYRFYRYVRGKWDGIFTENTYSPSAIAFIPGEPSDKVIYLASRRGHFSYSDDAGRSFKLISNIGFEPKMDNVSIYIAASPDFVNDRTFYFAHDHLGVYRTDDGGYSWRDITTGHTPERAAGFKIAISPDYANDGALAVGTDAGLYIYNGKEGSWRGPLGPPEMKDAVVEAVAVSPDYRADRTLMVSLRGRGLFRTTDGGKTFQHTGDDSISLSSPHIPSASMPIQFSPSYASDRTIYGYGAAGGRLFKSQDGGDTWNTIKMPEVGVMSSDISVKEDGPGVIRKIIDKIKKKAKGYKKSLFG
jgi:photosystem II stability/assembly factor-like uncharacterized protein